MEGALPTIAYNRGGGGGIGAVIFDKPSIDPLEALNLTIQREQQAEQQDALRKERQLARTQSMLKDINFDASGVFEYDLPMFREKTRELNDRAGALLQEYANQPDKQGEFMDRWQRDVLGAANDLKFLMENSKNDKQTLQKTFERAQTNKAEMADDFDAKIAEFNLTPVGGRNKDGKTRQELAASALQPSFNANKYITDVVSKIQKDATPTIKKGVDGSQYIETVKSVPYDRVLDSAKILYSNSNRFAKDVQTKLDELANSQDPFDQAKYREYEETAKRATEKYQKTITPIDVFIAETYITPLLGKEEKITGFLGRKPVRTESAAGISAKKQKENAEIFYRKYENFRRGDINEIDAMVEYGNALKNSDGSYSTMFPAGYSWSDDYYYDKGVKTLTNGNNEVLELRRTPEGTLKIRTLATDIAHNNIKKLPISKDFTQEMKDELLKEFPLYKPVLTNEVATFYNQNAKDLGGLSGLEYAKSQYNKNRPKVTDIRDVKTVVKGTVQKDERGEAKFVPTQQTQPQSAPNQTGNSGKSKGESFIDWKKRTGKTSYTEWGKL